jgi:hypothetical protein
MGIFGAGKAFNLRYAQSTYRPSRVCTPRQNKIGGGFLPFGGGSNSVTKITIKESFCWPSFVLGGAMGLLGLFNNTSCLAGSPYGTLNSAAGAAGAAGAAATPELTAEQEQAKQLTNLKTLFPDVSFVAEKDGKFSASKKDGTLLNNKTYDEMKAALSKQEVQGAGDPKVNTPGNDGDPKVNTPGNDGDPKVNTPKGDPDLGGKAKTTTKKSSTGSGMVGWYNRSTDNTHKFDDAAVKGKSASEITSLLLSTKLNGALSPAQQKELTAAIIKRNPSVFDKNTGSPLSNANYDKLDLPSMDWIKEHILKETPATKTDNKGKNSATAKVQGKTTELKNRQYVVNQMAQRGYTEVAKGLYSKNGKYYYLDKGHPTEIKNSDLKSINSDGTWVDTNGKTHKTFPTLPASLG